MQAILTGKTVLDVEMVEGLTQGRITMTLLGLGLVFAALLLIYRNLFKALIPLIPVVIIIGISSGLMFLLGIDYTPITATLGALVLGMGTEMTVMVLERYLEERCQNQPKKEAIEKAVGQIGKAILASGLTTVGGFSVLMFSEFVILQDFGLMTMINISLALISTFVVLPPIIVLFDRWIVSKNIELNRTEGENHAWSNYHKCISINCICLFQTNNSYTEVFICWDLDCSSTNFIVQ
jgi:predicted RND superfamily exporter protein